MSADERIGKEPDASAETEPLQQNGELINKTDKRSFAETCKFVLKNTTVEPTMAMFIIGCIIMMQTTQNLSLEKACRVNLNFTNEICLSLKMQNTESQNPYEKEVQQLFTKFISARTYISATIPCLIALFVGSWSDQTGRKKIFILIPITGQMLCCISSMLNTYFFHQLSLGVLIFSEAIIEGFSGGWCLAFFTMFAYISAITTHETRTFRMGLLSFSLTVGFPVGTMISGLILKNFGYYGGYGVSASMHIINLVRNIIWLRDPERSIEQKWHDGRGARHFFRTFFDFSNIKETMKVVFKNDPKRRRLRMCIMMIVVCLLFGPIYGEMSIVYLNARYRFNWDEVQFGVYQTYFFLTHTVGTIFSITVFSKYLQWHDSILGIISTVSKIAASFVYCFAPTGKIFYIAPAVEILNGTSLLAIKSIVSKLVAPDEFGKVNSIFGLTENLMPLLYVPLYTSVYKSTMEVLPGAVFLVGSAMTVPATTVFIWLLYEHRKEKTRLKYNGTELPLKDNLSNPNLVN